MIKATGLVTILSLVLIACSTPSTNESPRVTQQSIGDPLQSPDAPTLIPYRSVQKVNQPPAPPYPSSARADGIQGDVLVEVWINTEGTPTKSAALFGPKELQKCAADYALTWKFAPVFANGKPSLVRFRMLMPFKLRAGGVYRAIPKDLIY